MDDRSKGRMPHRFADCRRDESSLARPLRAVRKQIDQQTYRDDGTSEVRLKPVRRGTKANQPRRSRTTRRARKIDATAKGTAVSRVMTSRKVTRSVSEVFFTHFPRERVGLRIIRAIDPWNRGESCRR